MRRCRSRRAPLPDQSGGLRIGLVVGRLLHSQTDITGNLSQSTLNMVSAIFSPLWLMAVLNIYYLTTATEHQGLTSNDKCEYQIDLTKNTVRAVCHGQSSGVNVYAASASVMAGTVETVPGQSDSPNPPPRTFTDSDGSPPESKGHLTAALLNATSTVTEIRQNMARHSAAMANISSMLGRGHTELRRDLTRLRQLISNDAFANDIIAIMQNQYNLMRTAILAQNAELTKVIGLVDLLGEVSAESLENNLQFHRQYENQLALVNRTMLAMRKMFSTELKKSKGKRRSSNKKGRVNQLSIVWLLLLLFYCTVAYYS